VVRLSDLETQRCTIVHRAVKIGDIDELTEQLTATWHNLEQSIRPIDSAIISGASG